MIFHNIIIVVIRVFDMSSTAKPMYIGLQKFINLLSSKTTEKFSLYSVECLKVSLFLSFFESVGT